MLWWFPIKLGWKISHLIDFFIVNTDIDECATSETNDCGPNAVCNNTDGSYFCLCASGYKGDGRNCTGKYFSLKKILSYNLSHVLEFHWNTTQEYWGFLSFLTSSWLFCLCNVDPWLQILTNVPTLEQTNALLTHCAPTTRDLTPVAAGKDT